MQFRAALVGLAASLTAVAAQNSTCHNYVLISIRGTYEIQGPSIAFPGMINATLNAVPGGIEYDAVYPAAVNQTAYLGSDDVVRYITNGLENCPDQKYAILGYSQGASAAMIALGNYTEPGTPGYEAIRAVLVVGNPYHKPNETADVDQYGEDSTRPYSGALYNVDKPDSQGIPEIYYNNGKLLDICFQEDSICAPAYPNSSFVPGHLHYGESEVQELGASFLIPRFGGVYKNMTATSSAAPSAGTSLSATGVMPSGVKPSGTGMSPTGTGGLSPTGTGTGVVPPATGTSGGVVSPTSTGIPPTYPGGPISGAPASSTTASAAYSMLAILCGVLTIWAATN